MQDLIVPSHVKNGWYRNVIITFIFTLSRTDLNKFSSGKLKVGHMLIDIERLDSPCHTHLESKYDQYFLSIYDEHR
jgi:hypothetical protein